MITRKVSSQIVCSKVIIMIRFIFLFLPRLKVLADNVKVKTGLGGVISVWAVVGIISYQQEHPPSPPASSVYSLMISQNLITHFLDLLIHNECRPGKVR